MKHWISFSLIFCIVRIMVAQESSELANVYYEKGDYEKAVEYFKAATRKENVQDFYEKYRQSLIKLSEYKDLLKIIDKIEDKQYIHYVDQVLAYKALDKDKDAKGLKAQLLREAKTSEYEVQKLYDALEKRGENEWAIELIDDYRSFSGDNYAFADVLAALAYKRGDTQRMLTEYTNYVDDRPEMLEFVQDNLQQKLKDTDYITYEKLLYSKLSQDNKIVYHELLSWIYIQRRDFYNAFVEEKSIDLQKNLQAQRLFDLAQITMESEKYTLTKDIYAYVSSKYNESQIGEIASERLLEVKEIELRNSYPIDSVKANALLTELKKLKEKTHRLYQKNDITLKMARIKAYYLGDIPMAITMLESLLERHVGSDRSFYIGVKMELADLYLYDDQPWEAVLLYGQAASEGKESDQAHMAKLKTLLPRP